MPVPPLPLELVSLVVDHLATLLEGEGRGRRANGTSVSLVCRSWRKLGTELAWRTVVVESVAQARSVVAHLEQHSTPASCVRELDIRNGDASIGREFTRTVSSTLGLAEVFRLPIRLGAVRVDYASWLTSSLLVHELSRTEHAATLTKLAISTSNFDCAPSIFLRELAQFSGLSSLTLQAFWTGDIGVLLSSSSPSRHLLLTHLDLSLRAGSADSILPKQFNRGILDLISPSTLRHISCTAGTLDDLPFSSLASFTTLAQITLSVVDLPITTTLFDDMIALVQNLPLLWAFRLTKGDSGETTPAQRRVLTSTFPLTKLLSLLPLHLREFVLDGFDYPRSSFPPAKAPDDGTPTVALVSAADEEPLVPLQRDPLGGGVWWVVEGEA
ncbi:hypothetical protein JCM6882_003295 [Rhodosporidiobolus microsporus]